LLKKEKRRGVASKETIKTLQKLKKKKL